MADAVIVCRRVSIDCIGCIRRTRCEALSGGPKRAIAILARLSYPRGRPRHGPAASGSRQRDGAAVASAVMWRVRIAVAGAVVVGGVRVGAAWPAASADAER